MDTQRITRTAGQIGREWFEKVWGENDRSAIYDFLSPDAKGHLEGGQTTIGPEPFAEFHQVMDATFKDRRLGILAVVEQGDQVCVHWEFTGTHSGDGLGMPPTSQEIKFTGMTRFVVEDDLIVEGWDCWNYGGTMARMGAADEVIRAH